MVHLAPLTTLRLGGPARELVEATTQEEVVELVADADERGERVLVLAGGSNVVIADVGFDGLVVLVRTRGIERDGSRLRVEAGEPWDPLVEMTVSEGLAGFECLSGIPGSTGATPIQNVGAYGQEVSSTIASVRAYDRDQREIVELGPEDCRFTYRNSAFKGDDRFLILAVGFELRDGGASDPIRYAELARKLGVEIGDRAPVADVRDAVLELRRGKGMVIDPGDPDSVSAGSFFTNPIISREQFEDLPEAPPAWPEPDGRVKVSAAWLIESSGFHKGYARGPVGISTKHTLALITRDGARTEDLVALAREVAAGVRDRFGIDLTPEPVFVGHAW